MNWLKEWYENKKRVRQERKAQLRIKQAKERASEMFTIDELNGHLWISCDGVCIIPCRFFEAKSEEDIIKLLDDIRNFYVENTTKGD